MEEMIKSTAVSGFIAAFNRLCRNTFHDVRIHCKETVTGWELHGFETQRRASAYVTLDVSHPSADMIRVAADVLGGRLAEQVNRLDEKWLDDYEFVDDHSTEHEHGESIAKVKRHRIMARRRGSMLSFRGLNAADTERYKGICTPMWNEDAEAEREAELMRERFDVLTAREERDRQVAARLRREQEEKKAAFYDSAADYGAF